MERNILITGISGMLGMAVYKYFKEVPTCKIYGVSRNDKFKLENAEILIGNLTSREFLNSFQNIKFDTIFHCSAEIDVNYCETNNQHAYNSNVLATELVSSILQTEKFVYISTDSVFDGKYGNYKEDSIVNPLSYYAKTKYLGEEVLKNSTNKYFVLRTNIYGFNNPMKKSLFEWAYKELKENRSINGFSNMFFNPLYVGQLASFLGELISNDIESGVYNISTDEVVSKYDFLNKIACKLSLGAEKINSIEFKQDQMIAPRALNTSLNNGKIKSIFRDFDFSFEKGLLMLNNDLQLFENQ
jgi:dTDP-4-dehydrorhamnose reductase